MMQNNLNRILQLQDPHLPRFLGSSVVSPYFLYELYSLPSQSMPVVMSVKREGSPSIAHYELDAAGQTNEQC